MPDIEYHSGEITRPCPKNIQLRQEGKFNPEMQTAMYRGAFASYLMEYLHGANEWDDDAVAAAGVLAIQKITDDIEKEGRELSDTVENSREDIHSEVLWCIIEYARRLGPMFKQCKFIGCELPCRVTVSVTPTGKRRPKKINFASHTDLLFRDPLNVFGQGKNRLCLWDFKFTKDSPTWDYLTRQPQLLLYFVCGLEGSFLLDDMWIEFNEAPALAWCHLPHLKPFKRRTTCTDDDGVTTEYVKGNARPLKNVVRWCNYRIDRLDDIKFELCQRPLMYEAGFYPMIPDAIGCHLCESREWCPRFDLSHLEGDSP